MKDKNVDCQKIANKHKRNKNKILKKIFIIPVINNNKISATTQFFILLIPNLSFVFLSSFLPG